jgi:hypothetical protein
MDPRTARIRALNDELRQNLADVAVAGPFLATGNHSQRFTSASVSRPRKKSLHDLPRVNRFAITFL